MSGSRVVDMDRWRARARVPRTTGPGGGGAPAARAGTGGAVTATVLALPDPRDTADTRRPGAAGPSSVFGPVVAFGLVPRAASTPAARDEAAPAAAARRRRPRARHRDARGATRGPHR